MSRVATPPVAPPASPPSASAKVTHEKIAQRAYEKWCKRGCAHGMDAQDWLEAEAELKAEMMKGAAPAMPAMPATKPPHMATAAATSRR